jgi:hypothetical protein
MEYLFKRLRSLIGRFGFEIPFYEAFENKGNEFHFFYSIIVMFPLLFPTKSITMYYRCPYPLGYFFLFRLFKKEAEALGRLVSSNHFPNLHSGSEFHSEND